MMKKLSVLQKIIPILASLRYTRSLVNTSPDFYKNSCLSCKYRTKLKVRNLSHDEDNDLLNKKSSCRRDFLNTIVSLPVLLTSNDKAQARGLVRFPCKDYEFLNKYHFMRAGESLLEEEGVWTTNPLFLTNRESALSENGILQIEEACRHLKAEEINPTVVRYSLAASAIDTADIVGRELKIGRNNLVPEFNFMDPRAIGKWDMLQLNSTQRAVWAMDQKEAGNDGQGGKPPPNEDSTPNETLADQVVRLQQLLSVLETQYSGETILLVFPDGTGPALMTCLIGGVPLNRVHEFEYKNGEVRVNINYDNAHDYITREPSDEYLDIIKSGEKDLKKLRSNPNEILNVREEQFLREQKEEEELKRKKEEELKKQQNEEALKRKKENARLIEKHDSNNKVDASSYTKNNLVIAGLSAVGAIGSLFVLGRTNDDEEEIISFDSKSAINSDNNEEQVTITSESLIDQTTTPPFDTNDKQTIVISDTMSSSSDQQNTSWDPNKDDGGEAWLGALSELMNENDEEVDWQ